MEHGIVVFFLGLSLILYVTLGGADFGAGILELTAKRSVARRLRDLTYHAIGPIWEANHVWIILVIVILFVGFPRAYAEISTSLHIPLSLLLLGIIIRGAAFTFRHYDAIKDDSQHWYDALFRGASAITPFFLGVCAGAVLLGEMRTDGTFPERFLSPWLNPFCFLIGAFLTALCAMLAAAFILGEVSRRDIMRHIKQRAFAWSLATVVLGGVVLLAGAQPKVALTDRFLQHPVSLLCFAGATVLLFVLWWAVYSERGVFARIAAAGISGAILLGWFAAQYPVLIHFKDGSHLTLDNAFAPPAAIDTLAWTLVGASLLIVPALGALFWIFKRVAHRPAP
ncbi:MAG: cytochrome d ubiquinol oxidase subunit II [Bdellovibrionales bacterium]|nr:cytochrome d ubiquinol oxidase subunit II [Bdellovibrionales bacterium]